MKRNYRNKLEQLKRFGAIHFNDGTGEGGGGGEGEGGGDDPAALLAAKEAEIAAMQAKMNELLAETKKAKTTAREAERIAQEEARKKAEAEGNFKQLFESSEKERMTLAEQLESIRRQTEQKEISQTALKIAASLAEGDNVELLAEFVQRRLKYAEDGVKVTDNAGNLTVSSIDDLKREFAGSARYASLIKGRQSSGGGATGGAGGGAAVKEITRAQFDALDPIAKAKHIRGGGKVTD